MGLFGKKKEKQNRSTVFIMYLLMENPCGMPEKSRMCDIMEKHLKTAECFCYNDKTAGFAVTKYKTEFKDATVPPQLMIMGCTSSENLVLDDIKLSQMWDCPESKNILDSCKYYVVATDMLAAGLEYKDRADMLMDYMEALIEIYPECKAVLFETSGKMFTRDQIINHDIPHEDRFIYFAVNVRFFNIEGTQDMLVDTLGMSTLFLPDLQYHFHDIDPDNIVNHAYNVLLYIYKNDCPVENGDTIDGLKNGIMSSEVMWKCQYEDSLIQPERLVIDINTGEYASGNRS